MKSKNYFMENNRLTSVTISKLEIVWVIKNYRKIHRFFKNKIISSKDNIDISNKICIKIIFKKLFKKNFIKNLNIDFTKNTIIFSEFCGSQLLWYSF